MISNSARTLDGWLHRHLIYPAAVSAVGETDLFARLQELRVIEKLHPTALMQMQTAALGVALDYAQAQSGYYHRTWPAGDPSSFADPWSRLRMLPLLTKRELQEHLGDLVSRQSAGRVSQKITGGSTGQAVTVLKDRRATARERAAMWWAYGWRGVRIGDRVARFWGAPFAARRRWLTRAADFAMHRIRFSAFAFDEADLERYWRRCLAFRPNYFHGYVSMLEAFARFVHTAGYDGRLLRLKSIIATSEVLTAPQRNLLEQTFGCPVQIEYGCGEVGPIAYECEHGSLHVMAQDLVVEVLGPDGHEVSCGEAGEVVVTDLNNRAMPLVRYRLGDFAVVGQPCECGRPLPALSAVWGRAYDFVLHPDGRRYHGEFFMYLIEDLRRAGIGIGAFQIHQTSSSELHVAIVGGASSSGDAESAVRALLSERLPGMSVQVSHAPAIPRTASGKMQLIVNDLTRTQSAPASEPRNQ